jgi:hypothetical protein
MSELPPPVVVLPERLDRSMRLGPFPSARAALKFVTYGAIGALLVPFAGALVWLPFLLGGFLVSVYRPEEKSPDERVLDLLRYRWRRSGAFALPPGRTGRARGSLIRLPSGCYVAIVETRGNPVLHLPPEEMEQLFRLYRDFLRGLDVGCAFVATLAPLSAIAFEPNRAAALDPLQSDARRGYDELVRLLCRRRFVRRIFFAFGSPDRSAASVTQLEGRVAMAIGQLALLGVGPRRLRGAELKEAAYRFDWPAKEVS